MLVAQPNVEEYFEAHFEIINYKYNDTTGTSCLVKPFENNEADIFF